MRNIYLNPEIAVEAFDIENILTTSGDVPKTETEAVTMAKNDLSGQDLELQAIFAME